MKTVRLEVWEARRRQVRSERWGEGHLSKEEVRFYFDDGKFLEG